MFEKIAKSNYQKIIINLAPAQQLNDELLKDSFLLCLMKQKRQLVPVTNLYFPTKTYKEFLYSFGLNPVLLLKNFEKKN